MKQLIIILLFPFVCNAQKSTIKFQYTESTSFYSLGRDSGAIRYQYDTIPCVMLVCDTSLQVYTYPTTYMTNIDYKDLDYSVRWRFGYFVQVRSTFFLKQGEYLDENKIALSKNKIIWISKQLK